MRPARTVLLLAPAVAALAYARFVRPWQLTWGATAAEVSRALPSDDLVPNPTFNATRAITIAAPPEAVWPWIVQMGLTRAGWYSYDLLDNLGRPSARRILPEFQDLQPGDIVPMSPDGKQGMKVHSINAPQSMVWGEPGGTTWAWQLDAGRPRLDQAHHPGALALPVALPIHRVLRTRRVRRHLDDAQDAGMSMRSSRSSSPGSLPLDGHSSACWGAAHRIP